MIDYTLSNLRNHYDKIYDKPQSDSEAISLLCNVYSEEMKKTINQEVKDGIGEYYRQLLGKGLPSYYWILEAIHRTAKKREEKRHFRYVVGTLKNWSLYGFGNTYTGEEEEIFDYFSEITNFELTHDSRKVISALMGRYGAFKVMRNMPSVSQVDVALILSEILANKMIDRYDKNNLKELSTIESLPEGKTKEVSKVKTTKASSKKQDKNKKPTALRESTKLMILYVEEYLQSRKGYFSPTEIANFLIEKGYSNINPRNMTSNLTTIMKNSNHVVKVGTGKYQYKN